MQNVQVISESNVRPGQFSFDFEEVGGKAIPTYSSRLGTMAGRSTSSIFDEYDDIGEQIAILILEKQSKKYVSNSTDDATRYGLYQWFYLGEPDNFGRTFSECLGALRADDTYDKYLDRLESMCSKTWFEKLKQYLKTGIYQQQQLL